MARPRFSLTRLAGMIRKEFIQLQRDRLTFAMLIGIPMMQLILFGYAINADPKYLPAAIVQADDSEFSRSYLQALENTGYFNFIARVERREEVEHMFTAGEVLFVITIPEDFSRSLVRGERPAILLEVDATDPIAIGPAIAAVQTVTPAALNRDMEGVLQDLKAQPGPIDLRIHRRYNPENITQYNTVPGLIGVILTLTLVMVTAIALARERERGTLEYLYSMPLLPVEVMIGKITPFIVGAYIQVTIVLIAARVLFHVPILGSLWLLSLALILFIIVNLAIGFTLSTIVKTQLQASQMATFFFLPSILLSGFVFPFKGMPVWAQFIGEALPLTHFLRIVRGIMLKDAAAADIWPHIWPLMVILLVVSTVALKRYRATLD